MRMRSAGRLRRQNGEADRRTEEGGGPVRRTSQDSLEETPATMTVHPWALTFRSPIGVCAFSAAIHMTTLITRLDQISSLIRRKNLAETPHELCDLVP
jgi:hypothetical protein